MDRFIFFETAVWISPEPVVFLLGSNTKVAPIKTLSIPRLKLCAVQLAAKLTRHFVNDLGLLSAKIHLWSDSKDVLYWFREIPSKCPTFIANRWADIATTLPDASRHHINSVDNPTDMATRGISPIELTDKDLWWHGPRRLRENNLEYLWTSGFCSFSERSAASHAESLVGNVSVNIAIISTFADSEVCDLVSRYSSLSKLVRISIYILRFVKRTLRHVSFSGRISPVIRDFSLHDHFTISGDEVRYAKILWCYLT